MIIESILGSSNSVGIFSQPSAKKPSVNTAIESRFMRIMRTSSYSVDNTKTDYFIAKKQPKVKSKSEFFAN